MPLLADVTSDQENSGTTETLTYDRVQAARFGIQPAMIDNILYDAFGQREVAQYFTGNKAYYVILETLPDEYGTECRHCRNSMSNSSTGVPVPLSTFVHMTTVPVQPLAINHHSQFPAVTISFNLRGNASLGDVVTQVDADEAVHERARNRGRKFPRHGAGLSGLVEFRTHVGRGRLGHGLHHPGHSL